ncbi:Uncharacterised protein [Mycobacteroides abscessus subsp. abscessus]|jgi:hypothetical protein|nr:hypothetical protein [Mycobacteroides abscessus]SLD40623.1 Uncharacterised protein [Mycobacteroides abscessus subsp. abscessus]SLG78359.1 Uncharacterised protein [Mycobacteroides abscessus subsp. abscessus]SLL28706.1 Uncharacterised protein [Mycobacteroides abscessus subsp. abscessus]
MADGLDSLTAMRSKSTTSRRTIPPPRHPPRRTPVDMPAAPAPSPATASEPPKAQPAAPAPATPPPATGTDLTKVSIYLDDTSDAYLETVRAAARATKPRVDATRSAVVRLALNRLAEQFTPAEIVAELQRSAATHSGPGRKRA